MNNDNSNIFSPFYTVTIRTEAQARLYNRLLVAKIVGLLIVLAGLLALNGWKIEQILFALVFGTVWQAISMYRRGTLPFFKRRR